MIQIAICDDQRTTTEDLETLLYSYAKEKMVDINVTFFSSPSVLHSHMSQESMDIVFMDLDFGIESEDGILWSSRIHQDFPQTLVLILTAYENRYKEGFVARAFRFMGKPFSKDELYSNMNACVEELSLYKAVTLSRRGITQKVSTKDILYFAAKKGGCDIKTAQESQSSEKSLLQWESQMPSTIFFRCHKKYLVNLNAIKQLDNHMILLENGEKLPVARRKWTLLKTAFMKFDISLKGREINELPT